MLERRIDRSKKASKGDKKYLAEVDFLERLKEFMEGGKSARAFDFTDDERTHQASLGIDYALPYRHGYIYYSNGFVEMYGTDLLKYNSNVIMYTISLIGPELFYRPKAATNPCWAHHVSITPSLAVAEDDIFGNFGDVENLYKIYCLGARDLSLIVKNDTGRDVLINWRIWGLSRKGAVS